MPFGYLGSGFGWSNSHYYPGNGNFACDRRRNRRGWSQPQRRYWQQNVRHGGYGVHGRPVVVAPRGRPGYNRQQQRVDMQNRRAIQRQHQGVLQQQRVQRQQQRNDRPGRGPGA